MKLKSAGKTEERAAIEDCPVCGSKLERGYIASKAISWRDRKISNWWPPKGLLAGELIVSGGFPWQKIINVEAYRCRKCRLIIFRYGEAKDSTKENP
jgi:predicted RNA-binding Zn-ribbon protein involved in translation (DUF1610 family)